MKLKKLTLEDRVNNIENRIRKLESVLMRDRERDDNRYVLFDDKQIAFYEDEKKNKKLDECWVGNAAEGFKKINNDLVAFARNYHNSMKDVEELLTTVSNTVSNQ